MDSNKRTATSQKITNFFSVPATKKLKPICNEVAIDQLADNKKVSC